MYPPPSHGMSHVKNQISIAKGYEDTAWKRFSSSRSQGPGQKSNRQRNRLLHTYPPPKGMSHEKYQIPTTNGSGDIAWTRFSCSRSQDPGERSNQKKKCCCKPTPKGISHKNIKSLLLTAAKIQPGQDLGKFLQVLHPKKTIINYGFAVSFYFDLLIIYIESCRKVVSLSP